MELRTTGHHRPCRTAARLWHTGIDHPRANTLADVYRTGRLDAHRRGETQSAHPHPHHRQWRHHHARGGTAGLRPVWRGCRHGGQGNLRTPLDIQGDARLSRRQCSRHCHEQQLETGRAGGATAHQCGAHRRIPRHSAHTPTPGCQSDIQGHPQFQTDTHRHAPRRNRGRTVGDYGRM